MNDLLKDRPFLYWNKRGRATVIKDNQAARELIIQGSLWAAKCKDNIKPGQYNPIYDVGDGNIPNQPPQSNTVTSGHEFVDNLEGFII